MLRPNTVISTSGRIKNAAGLYVGVVLVASVAFYFLRQVVAYDSPARYAYATFGPALSLFTHASVFLFAAQSTFVFPWLLIAGTSETRKLIRAIGFAVSWLVVGFCMYDLF